MNCAIIIKDAKFFGHITQTILSGQYVVYNGKYYDVPLICTAADGITVSSEPIIWVK